MTLLTPRPLGYQQYLNAGSPQTQVKIELRGQKTRRYSYNISHERIDVMGRGEEKEETASLGSELQSSTSSTSAPREQNKCDSDSRH